MRVTRQFLALALQAPDRRGLGQRPPAQHSHAGSGELQRIGLQPDVVVRPTVAGIRAGRDEVLERALGIIKE